MAWTGWVGGNQRSAHHPRASSGKQNVTLWPGCDLMAMDRGYGFPLGRPEDNSVLHPGMEIVFLKTRYTSSSPSEHICEDLIEAVVERLVGKKSAELRFVSINGMPGVGTSTVRMDSMSRYLLKRRCLPGEAPVLLDPMNLPWVVDIYVPPPPLVSVL